MKIINEGINDKNLFKCVFMAGGGGSGKGWISQNYFGINKNVFDSPFGVKVVNSDNAYEYFLKKGGLSLKIDPDDEEMFDRQMGVRDTAKKVTNLRLANYIEGMLPLIIDGTAKEYDKISKQKNLLESQGYDTSMIFVNTTLEVALQRNQDRERTVPVEVATEAWYEVQDNLGKFQSLFGHNNFYIVDNSTQYTKEETKKLILKMFKLGQKIISEPLKNRKGIQIIDQLRATGGKYMSDFE